jgi:Tfp pilus assembly protein PilO
LAPLASRDVRALKILAIFLCIAGLVALYVYVFIPQMDRLAQAREELQASEMLLRADIAKLNRADESKAKLATALQQLRNEEALIADEVKQAYFLRDIEAMAKRSGVKLNSVRFSGGKLLGRFLDVATHIDITGSFAGVKLFYDALEVLNRKLAVTNFSFDIQSEAVPLGEGLLEQKESLHSICSLSLFIRPKGGALNGSAK